MRKAVLVLGLFFLLAAGLVGWRLADHDLDQRRSEPFEFGVADIAFDGTLWLPDGDPRAAIVLVHGDGPQDRTSGGGYAPFVNTMLDAGIAVAAWDKAGIGLSTGNWLDQSMEDRAGVVRAALAGLKARLPDVPAGAVGFSQAGWVLPKLEAGDADFLVLIGAAVSWRRQGAYYTATRLRREGMEREAIDIELERQARLNESLFGPKATFDPGALSGMSKARWTFIRRNRAADAASDLSALRIPLLALWGEDDLNVEAATNAADYHRLTASGPADMHIRIVPGATHGLLKSAPYNYQLVEDWPQQAKWRFLAAGRAAYAPGVLAAISAWIIATTGEQREVALDLLE